jgi:hypothetical protein
MGRGHRWTDAGGGRGLLRGGASGWSARSWRASANRVR